MHLKVRRNLLLLIAVIIFLVIEFNKPVAEYFS